MLNLYMFQYDWDWSVIWRYHSVLIKGVVMTLQLSGTAIVIGTFLGSFLGVVLASKDESWKEIRQITSVLIDVVRSLPVLILILAFNYWLPYFVHINSPFWLACLALAVNLSAFIADVLRGAIEGVPRPIIEAGYAVGMDSRTVTRRILIPEATRQIIPTLALLYIDILKLSSLASVIAVRELVHVATEVSTVTFQFPEIFAALAFIYMIIVLPFSYGARRLERAEWFLRRS